MFGHRSHRPIKGSRSLTSKVKTYISEPDKLRHFLTENMQLNSSVKIINAQENLTSSKHPKGYKYKPISENLFCGNLNFMTYKAIRVPWEYAIACESYCGKKKG